MRSISTPLALLAGLTIHLGASAADAPPRPAAESTVPARPGIYAPVTLRADLGSLTARERDMVGLLIDAAAIMDDLFWRQAYPGDRAALLGGLSDPEVRRYAEINYGPWDRLAGNAPFVPGMGPKPPGAGFYPLDMTKDEFERANLPNARSEYTVLRRGEGGALEVVPYSVHYRAELERAATLLERAAALADEPGLRRYLELRARALRTDDYRSSDMAWLDMKDNRVDVVIGPIETYEDKLYGYKAAFEAYVLVKDLEWSRRLARYAAMLPALQRGLPVPEAYKRETPGTDSDLNAYDVVYYAGDCNAGSKTIAINLPNDEQVQLAKGTRRLQLKNAMRAKFDAIMVPIAGELIAPEQRRHVTFDAFFANTMFHEVAHGLGIKNTVDGKGTVRDALKERASGIEEGKADVLGLYMVTRLHEQGELAGALEDYYVTFLAGIFRSVRFGAASAHGEANMVRFNFFADRGAFARGEDGHYRVDMPRMRRAVDELSAVLLKLQGDGDYAGVERLGRELGVIRPGLQADLDRLSQRSIPVDVVFEQGKSVLGLATGVEPGRAQ
ncbi:MAG: Zn-dependent hydrolase [Lysobacterales bacterium]|nr:MAG: Zn-dependent hydrolase [Xanthomonadales bacterium]